MKINQYDITMAPHYDITMDNDVARDAHCEIIMVNDVTRDIHLRHICVFLCILLKDKLFLSPFSATMTVCF